MIPKAKRKSKQKTYTPKELIEIFKKSPYSSGHTLNFLKWLQQEKKEYKSII